MSAGFNLTSWRGQGGRIVVPGLGAVLADLDTWTLERREDSPADDPRWDLRGAFKYANPVLLKQEGLGWNLEIELRGTRYHVTFDPDKARIDANSFSIQGAKLNARS